MTLTEVKTAVGVILEDTSAVQWTAATIVSFVNRALQEFARRTRCYRKFSAALTEAATTPDNAFYTVPTDLVEIISVWDYAQPLELRPATPEALGYSWNSTTGTPIYFIFGPFGVQELRVWPIPSAALSQLQLFYVAQPATMVNSTHDAVDLAARGIPLQYHQAIVDFVVAECYRRNFEEGDMAKRMDSLARYEAAVLDCAAKMAANLGGLRPGAMPFSNV